MREPREPLELRVRKGSVLEALPEPLLPGEKRQLGRLTIWIQDELGDASAKRIYRAAGSDGASYAYKEARDASAIAKEEERTLALVGKVPVARVMQTGQGSDVHWILREWIVGFDGEAWLALHADGEAPDESRREDLRRFLSSAIALGLEIGKLEPENLVWREGTWHVVECGKIRQTTPEQARARYEKKFLKRWGFLP